MIGTQTTKGTDLKNPTTLGVKSCKLPTEVLSTTPMTASPVRSKSLNSFTEASSIQNKKLYVQGELTDLHTIEEGLMPSFFYAMISQ